MLPKDKPPKDYSLPEDHDDSLGGTADDTNSVENILVYGFFAILCTSLGICIGALLTYYIMR